MINSETQTRSVIEVIENQPAPPPLTPEAQREAAIKGSPADRSNFVWGIAVNVDHYRLGMRCMEGVLERSRRSDNPSGLWLIGDGGEGKSFLLESFARRHPPVETTTRRVCEVILIRLRGSPSESQILLAIMLALGQSPHLLAKILVAELRTLTLEAMAHCGVLVLLFDEAHHLWLSTHGKIKPSMDRSGGLSGDFTKTLYEDSRVGMVFSGTKGLNALYVPNKQANTRWMGRLELKPFENDAKFAALLDSLDAALPMEERSNLAERRTRKRIYEATQGNFRRLKHLLSEAVFIASEAGDRSITQSHLAEAFTMLMCNEDTPFG